MPEPFKNLLGPDVVEALALHLARSAKAHKVKFGRKAFVRLATVGLEPLGLKARCEHIAEALRVALPLDFAEATSVLVGALAPQTKTDDLSVLRTSDSGVAGFVVWPLTIYVAHHGGSDPKRALASLREMTMRFSSEFAIRAFLTDHPVLTFSTLARWARDPNVHVRRLVSEGSRPRLPWGKRLDALVADPSPTLPLLEVLRDDPSEYVRRSVANHLNDIAKDHPVLFAEILESWMCDASVERKRLLAHASRTLVKSGDPRVLRAFGAHRALEGQAALTLTPERVQLGEAVTVRIDLVSASTATQKLVIDYVVHHVRANGTRSPKTFKGWTLSLGPGEIRSLERRHAIRPITTRRYYSGTHEIECRINGQSLARVPFDLDARANASDARTK